MSTPFKWGDEFLINQITVNAQTTPAVAALADGRFIATWTDYSFIAGDNSASAVRCQIFAADGSMVGGEFLVNTTTASNQQTSAVSALESGRFVVVWEDYGATGGDTSGAAIRAQIFNSDGSKSGGEFLVNGTSASNQTLPALTALANGDFVVAWTDSSQTGGDTSHTAVRAQVFHDDGTAFGSEFLINTTTVDDENTPNLTALDNGGFVAVWQYHNPVANELHAQIFNADGSLSGSEFLVDTTNTGAQTFPVVTTLANGGFVVAWQDASGVGGDTSSNAIHAQMFAADGGPLGGEFLANTTTFAGQFDPAIVGLADGRCVIAWADASLSGSDVSGTAIRAQVFNADGSQHGVEFLVNTATLNAQQTPTITTLADGRFVIGWADFSGSGDASSSGIKGQIFDERDAAVHLNGTLSNDFFIGTFLADGMSGGFGNDTLIGGQGDDDLYGGIGNDVLTGNKGNEQIFGGDGDDALFGGQGSDVLDGGTGNDLLDGGSSQDALIGGTGDDTYVVDLASDVVTELSTGNAGRDVVESAVLSLDLGLYHNVEDEALLGIANLNLTGDNLNNKLTGNDGNNILTGNDGVDALLGGGGGDALFGGGRQDFLTGGLGADTMSGGVGNDTFIFLKPTEPGNLKHHDEIADFTPGQDRIDLHLLQLGQTFIATAFEGIKGQVRYEIDTGLLMGDLNGDRVADYYLELTTRVAINGADLIL